MTAGQDGQGGPPGEAVVVDARGLRCPLPVLRLAAAARGLPAGTRASVLATDPAVVHDVPAWARMRGHELVAVEQQAPGGGAAEGATGPGEGTVYRVTVALGG